MRNGRLARCLVYPVLLLAVTPGCQAFHRYRPVSIEAMDTETKQPIPGVEVKISYPLETSSFAPSGSKEITGVDGIARLQAAPYGRAGVMIEVSAKGFLSEQKYLSVQEVEAIEPAQWFEDVKRRPTSYVMEMFAGPAPAIELIVPIAYRGQIKAKIQVQADLAYSAGQRTFSYKVPDSGEVAATGPPVFRHLSPANVRVKFDGNLPLSLWAKESEFGYWLLKCEGTCYYFLVGTQRDYDDYRRSLQNGGPERPSRGSGSSEGKGRRGRKGMLPSGDSNP
jgi:hypothetical protein